MFCPDCVRFLAENRCIGGTPIQTAFNRCTLLWHGIVNSKEILDYKRESHLSVCGEKVERLDDLLGWFGREASH